MSMCGNALPIGHNPVLMIGADGCVEGAFGDWDMVYVASDWRIGRLVWDMHWNGRLAEYWHWKWIGN